MTMQPCPDCGTIMNDCDTGEENGCEPAYWCPECCQLWTQEEIYEEYRLNYEFENREDKPEGVDEE